MVIKTGFNYKATDKMDAADIILQKEVNIDHRITLTLHDKLATSAVVLIDALNNIENNLLLENSR